MVINYKLNKDLTGRAAAMLNWKLGTLNSSVRIVNKEEDRIINAKSLIGLLSGCFKTDSIIEIVIDNEKELEKIKEAFNEVGDKV